MKASYAGNSTYAAVVICTKLSVTKAAPTIAVKLHNETHQTVDNVVIGQPFHVKVTMNSDLPVTGRVTFTVSKESDCLPNDSAGSATLADEVAESGPLTGSEAGNLYVKARYEGNALYFARYGPCQKIVINRRLATVTLRAHDAAHTTTIQPVKVGTKLHMFVDVGGVLGPGSGNLDLYTYSDAACANETDHAIASLSGASFDAIHPDLRTVFPSPTDSYWRV